MGNQVVILDLPYKRFLSSYQYPMSASFGKTFDFSRSRVSTSTAVAGVVSISQWPSTNLYYLWRNILTILLDAVMAQDLLYKWCSNTRQSLVIIIAIDRFEQ
jgi:hypothetical protein